MGGAISIDPSDFEDRSEVAIEPDEDNIFESSRSWIVRTIRALIILTIGGILITFAVLLLVKYETENVRVVSKIKINQSPFPAITLCNLNPYKLSMIGTLPYLSHSIETFDRLFMSSIRPDKESRVVKRHIVFTPKTPDCLCNFDDAKRTNSFDGQRIFVLYPRMKTESPSIQQTLKQSVGRASANRCNQIEGTIVLDRQISMAATLSTTTKAS